MNSKINTAIGFTPLMKREKVMEATGQTIWRVSGYLSPMCRLMTTKLAMDTGGPTLKAAETSSSTRKDIPILVTTSNILMDKSFSLRIQLKKRSKKTKAKKKLFLIEMLQNKKL